MSQRTLFDWTPPWGMNQSRLPMWSNCCQPCKLKGLEHLHPLAPTGVGPVPTIVIGRGSRHPPHRRVPANILSLPIWLKTLNPATWNPKFGNCLLSNCLSTFGVQNASRQGSGAGSTYAGTGQGVGVGGSPVNRVAGQSCLFSPLASPPKPPVEIVLVNHPGGALDRVFEDHVRSSSHYMGAMYVNFVDFYRHVFTWISKLCSFHVPYLSL